jgi:hypothetical protein
MLLFKLLLLKNIILKNILINIKNKKIFEYKLYKTNIIEKNPDKIVKII